MSTTLKLKRSSQTGNAPDTNNIVEGELALNTADAILYSRGGSTIFQIGANITESFTVNPGTAADTITLGATAQTGTITLGQSTKDNTINIGNAATESDQEQIINIGSGTGSGTSTVNIAAKASQGNDTAVTIGGNDPNSGTTTVAIRGTTTLTSGDVNFNGYDFNVLPNIGARTITIGSTTQSATGIITLGQSTATNTINIGNAQTVNGATQTINIGGNNQSGGDTVLNLAANTATAADTAVTIGSSNNTGTHTVAIRGTTTFSNGDVSVPSHRFSAKNITVSHTHTNNTTSTDNIAIGINSGATSITKNVNIGTGFHNGGVTNINIGPTSGTTTKSINLNANTTVGNSANLTLLGGTASITKNGVTSIYAQGSTNSDSSTSHGIQIVNTFPSSDSKLYLNVVGEQSRIESATASNSALPIRFMFGNTGEKFRMDGANGRFGIGTSSPAEALHVVGDIIATGNVTAYYSDERLKDLKGAIPDALDKVNNLTGYYYKPNALAHSLGVDNTELEVGVSAQEVEEVLPEIVTKSAVGQDEFGEDYKSVHYDKLTPLLIEAIKELTQKVSDLETKIQRMEK